MKRFNVRHILTILVLIGAAFVWGCGDGPDSNPVGSGQGQAVSFTPGDRLLGRVVVRPTMIVLDPADRPGVLGLRDTLEARGMILSENGELMVWPESPASAWKVTVGDQEVVLEPDGTFEITAPESSVLGGRFTHPSDEGLEPVDFPLNLLSRSEEEPGKIVIPLVFPGGCGMGIDEFCGPGPRPRFEPPEFSPSAGPNMFWGVVNERRGSYPPPDAHITSVAGLTCPQYDGFLSDGSLTVSSQNYVGSTCDANVLDGTCPNENPLSDAEYKVFADGLGSSATLENPKAAALGLMYRAAFAAEAEPGEESRFLTPPSATGLVDGSCLKNHKGRMCGLFKTGDVSVDIGEVIFPGAVGTLKVMPGEKGSIVVHNNGVFGFTNVTSVSLAPEVELKAGPEGKIEHFEELLGTTSNKKHRYVADRTVEFEVDRFAEVGRTFPFRFAVDDKLVVLVFEIVDEEVAISPPVANLGSQTTQAFSALPQRDDTNLIYRWFLSFGTGTLSSTSEADITYTVSDPSQLFVQDTLNLEVFEESREGERVLLGEASAEITYGTVNLDVTPAAAFLSPGDAETFTASVTGAPTDGTIVYQWESVSGFGTFSTPDQVSTQYTVSASVIPPKVDTVRLTVFSEDSDGARTLIGIKDIAVDIGADWAQTRTGAPGPGGFGLSETLNTLSFGNGFFLGSGFDNNLNRSLILTSPDGISWTKVTPPTNLEATNNRALSGLQVLWAEFRFDSPPHTVISSTSDGSIFSVGVGDPEMIINDVALGNGDYVAVGRVNGNIGTECSAKSTNLSSWAITQDPNVGQEAVCFGGGQFVSGSTFISTSAVGVTWSRRLELSSLGITNTITKIEHLDGKYIAVTSGAAQGASILTSTNGIDWVKTGPLTVLNGGFDTSVSLHGIAFGNGLFRAGGGDTLGRSAAFVSEDGISWSLDPGSTALDQRFFGFDFGNGRFVGAGRGSSVLVTPKP